MFGAINNGIANLGAGPSSAPGVGGSVSRWAGVVDAVLAALGQPLFLEGAVLRRIGLESGGNPAAINLTDSNARAGYPSQGLVQTIPQTFAAYAGPYISRGILDPFANIYAGMNDAIHVYGSIAAIDPLVKPGGYDRCARRGAIGHRIGTRAYARLMIQEVARPRRLRRLGPAPSAAPWSSLTVG